MEEGSFRTFMILHIKLSRTAKALSAWARRLIPHGKLSAAIARELSTAIAREFIAQLESAQESHALSEEEMQLCKHLKRLLGLASIQQSRARQKSRLTWLKLGLGDANTRYFQAMASVRKKKMFIASFLAGLQMATSQGDRHNLVFNHYKNRIGSGFQRRYSINFQTIGWPPHQLQHLEAPFSENEVLATIKSMPNEKAPSLDGFIGAFFSSCWGIIKTEIMHGCNFPRLCDESIGFSVPEPGLSDPHFEESKHKLLWQDHFKVVGK
jgi:hypothetical protein